MKAEIIAHITGLSWMEADDLLMKINLLLPKKAALNKMTKDMLAWKVMPLTQAEADKYLLKVESLALVCPLLSTRSALFYHAANTDLTQTYLPTGAAVDLKNKLLRLADNPTLDVLTEKPTQRNVF